MVQFCKLHQSLFCRSCGLVHLVVKDQLLFLPTKHNDGHFGSILKFLLQSVSGRPCNRFKTQPDISQVGSKLSFLGNLWWDRNHLTVDIQQMRPFPPAFTLDHLLLDWFSLLRSIYFSLQDLENVCWALWWMWLRLFCCLWCHQTFGHFSLPSIWLVEAHIFTLTADFFSFSRM